MSVANNPFAIKKLMTGLGAMQEPQLSPEQQLYVKEKKSIEKLVRNYEIYPDRWGKDKLRKLKSLADRYEIPFEVERATSGQYAKSAIVGAVDSILFDMIPDDKYITPGTEGTASAGKWAGIVIPVLAATAATIATKGAAGPAAASTISRLMGDIAKSSPAAAKVLQTSGKVLKGAAKLTAPGLVYGGLKGAARMAGPALASRGISNPFVLAANNAAQKNFINQGLNVIKAGGPQSVKKGMEYFGKAGLNNAQIKELMANPTIQKAFTFRPGVVDTKQMQHVFTQAGITGETAGFLTPGGTAIKKLSGVLDKLKGGTIGETTLSIHNLQKAINAYNKTPNLAKNLKINESASTLLARLNRNGVTTVAEARNAIQTGISGTTPTTAMDMSGILPILFGGTTVMGAGSVDPLFEDPYANALTEIAQTQ